MPLEPLATFAILSFVLIVVPGPSVLFVVGRALSLGRRAALATVVGNATGVYLQAVVVAAGLGLVVERSELAFTALRLLGATYLAWLGVQAIRRRRSLAADLGRPVPSVRRGRAVRDGFIVGATNPKATVFFAAVLPQFVDPAHGSVPAQMLLLGVVFVVIALLSDSAWALAAGTARAWLARSPRLLGTMSAAGGALMVGLALALALGVLR